jgi:oxalate decarboxylase/phosphoglucose isomerase-like protein (cupin superfamily)
VIDGSLEFELEGKTRTLRQGEFAIVPKGAWHRVYNPGPNPARCLFLLSPPGFEGYWAESADLMAKAAQPLALETTLALQAKYNLDTADEGRRFE